MVLGLCFLLPSIVRLADIRHEHSDQACQLQGTVHMHKAKVVCDLEKLKLSTYYYQPIKTFSIFNNAIVKERPFPFDRHIKASFEPYFSLRAPPFFS